MSDPPADPNPFTGANLPTAHHYPAYGYTPGGGYHAAWPAMLAPGYFPPHYVPGYLPAPGFGHPAPISSTRSMIDIVLTALLLLCQTAVMGYSLFLAPMFAMGTDACSYKHCGAEVLTWAGMAIAIFGGLAVYIATGFATVRRLSGRRIAGGSAALGCALQITIITIALSVADLAGRLP